MKSASFSPEHPSRTLVRHLCIPALLLGGLTNATAATTDLGAGLDQCARIASARQRLACFDTLASSTRPSVAQTVSPTAPVAVAPPQMPEESPAPSRRMTAEEAPAAIARALDEEEGQRRKPWRVRPYRKNYLLPITYNDRPNRSATPQERQVAPFLGDQLDHAEMKFQISFELPLWNNLFNRDVDLYFGYTQISFLQAYNDDYSSPFRDNDYEPELGLFWNPHATFHGWDINAARIALDHQSNGRSQALSRSWNRLTGQIGARRDDLELTLRLWAPLEEEPADNPDIYHYMGYGEVHALYTPGKHEFELMFRNPARPTVQADWSYPITDNLRFYVQYFNGYGESMLDYNHSVNRIGLGIMLNTL